MALLSGGAIRGAAYGVRVYETESAYNYIQVIHTGSETQLLLDEGSAVHSIYDPTSLYTHGYWDDALLAPYFGSGHAPGRVALVGLAGGTVARQFTAIDGPMPIDGVEIDPKIVDVGRRYFDMNEPNLHVTVADFVTAPPKLAELNWSGMLPVLPGSICLSQVPAVVQPHPGRTSLISNVAVPTLVNTNECFTNSPELTLPKSYTVSAN